MRDNLLKARDLLEEAGWTLGDDGIRQKGGQRLTIETICLTQPPMPDVLALKIQAEQVWHPTSEIIRRRGGEPRDVLDQQLVTVAEVAIDARTRHTCFGRDVFQIALLLFNAHLAESH